MIEINRIRKTVVKDGQDITKEISPTVLSLLMCIHGRGFSTSKEIAKTMEERSYVNYMQEGTVRVHLLTAYKLLGESSFNKRRHYGVKYNTDNVKLVNF